MSRVLVIGGTVFVGPSVVRELMGRDGGLARALAWYAHSRPADPAAAAGLDYTAEDDALVTIRGSAVL